MADRAPGPSCGWEGPRGGGCNRAMKWRVKVGDPLNGPGYAAYSCNEHLDEIVREFRGHDLGDPVAAPGFGTEYRDAREAIRMAVLSSPDLFSLGADGDGRRRQTTVDTGGFL